MNKARLSILSLTMLIATVAAAKEHPGREFIEKNGYKGPATCEECHPGSGPFFQPTHYP